MAAVPVRIDFDHLALASEHAFDNFARYYGELGGRLGHGGIDPGFHFSQLRFPTAAGELAFELLEPRDLHLDDFLRRFLDRNGPGPHHVTFKVADVTEVLERAGEAGYTPVGVDLSNPEWQVAYLHPKQSHGVVIQVAHSTAPPRPYPVDLEMAPPKVARPAEVRRVVLAVADGPAAEGLFAGVLGGRVAGRGDDDLGRWVDLDWPGGGVLRLLSAAEPAAQAWVGNRLGRVHHVLLAVDEPGVVSGARPLGESGAWEVAPEDNLGTRLRLLRR